MRGSVCDGWENAKLSIFTWVGKEREQSSILTISDVPSADLENTNQGLCYTNVNTHGLEVTVLKWRQVGAGG